MTVENPNSGTNGGNDKPLRMGTTPASQQATLTTDTEKPGTEQTAPAPAATVENNGQGDETKTPVVDPSKEKQPEAEDYKTKFSESSREAQRLMEVLKANGLDPATGKPIAAPETKPANETVEIPTRTQTPQETIPLTDEQLTKALPGFANLSEQEKELIRDTKRTVKTIAALQNIVSELNDERVYTKQFRDLTKKEQFKGLADATLTEEFKDFAYKPENLQTPLEHLAASFLFERGLAQKPAEPKPQPSGLEPGSGGGKGGEKPKEGTDGYTAEELAKIRTTDPKRYFKLAREGKLQVRSGS